VRLAAEPHSDSNSATQLRHSGMQWWWWEAWLRVVVAEERAARPPATVMLLPIAYRRRFSRTHTVVANAPARRRVWAA